MDNHGKKMVAPVVIVLCIMLYYIVGIYALLTTNIPNIIKVTAVIFSIAITAVLIKVLIERIQEIEKGEEDDLGKY